VHCELKVELAASRRILLRVFALVAMTLGACHTRAQPVGPPVEADKKITIERCAQIAASDPRFGPLAQVCQYALAPNTLPNFVCDETVEQFVGNSGPKDWQHLAVITAEVIFEQGKGDRMAKVTKDGRPIRALSKPYKDNEVNTYFLNNLNWRPPVLNLFGSHLLWVFRQDGKAQFEYRGEMNADNSTMIVFGYLVRKGRGPSFGWNWPGQKGTYVAMKGLLWIDKATSSLKRMVVHYTDFDSGFDVFAVSSATDYGWVQISDLGKFLLPTGAEYIESDSVYGYWKDVVTFSNCRKYAGKSRILPAE
jgi:hypothetical protein